MTNKKFTRKEFLLFIGSLIGIFVLARIPGAGTRSKGASYGSGTYGGTHSA